MIRTDKIPTTPIANNKTDTISAIGTVAICIALSTLNCSMKNLMIDFYEFTMGQAYFDQGKKDSIAYFDVFFRKCPDNASFIIVNGVENIFNNKTV